MPSAQHHSVYPREIRRSRGSCHVVAFPRTSAVVGQDAVHRCQDGDSPFGTTLRQAAFGRHTCHQPTAEGAPSRLHVAAHYAVACRLLLSSRAGMAVTALMMSRDGTILIMSIGALQLAIASAAASFAAAVAPAAQAAQEVAMTAEVRSRTGQNVDRRML